ncbi:MAG: hypothetical protein HYR51_04480 [Candidatus Rokubacteria bacterium]|nr:hypothetical protein [Candidatus Rokubacteria bacterium]
MPSDDRVRLVLDALKPEALRFLGALDGAAEVLRRQLAAQGGGANGAAGRLAAELGPFGAARIDTGRLAQLLGAEAPAAPATLAALARALTSLESLAARGDALFVTTVTEAAGLRDTVAAALADIGRAFAAARIVHAVRTGHGGERIGTVAPLPFAEWMRSERRLAPPLVVRLLGSDLRAGGLAEFLDGRQKIVLVVAGDSAPAPLARLVTPRTFVTQTHDGAGLDKLAAWDGPAIAALVSESAASFVHDPAAGSASWQRITLGRLPENAPRRTLGGLSPAQQIEELELLRTLATRPPAAAIAADGASAPAPAAAADPAGRLAAWLLGKTDLSDLG